MKSYGFDEFGFQNGFKSSQNGLTMMSTFESIGLFLKRNDLELAKAYLLRYGFRQVSFGIEAGPLADFVENIPGTQDSRRTNV